MSAEVDWVLDTLQSVVDDQPADHPLKRVDRDDSEILEGSIQSRTADLQQANYVGATLSDQDPTPEIQNSYRVEATVGVRIEGLTHAEFGHVRGPDGEGVAWQSLVDQIRAAIRAKRSYPTVGRQSVDYHTVLIPTESPDSDGYSDYYRHDLEVLFRGRSTTN